MSTKQIMTVVDSQRQQISAALPAGFDLERVIRMVRTSLATSDQLQKCDPLSVLGAVIECAQLGLEAGITGHLVPFYDGRAKRYKAQLIADYRGLIALALRSGHVTSIYPDLIRQGDVFRITRGTNASIEHEPMLGNTGDVIAAYAVATLRNGQTQFEVVERESLDRLQKQVLEKVKANARKYAPWSTHPEEMQKKTAIRRLCKYLPFSTVDTDLQRAIVLDEQADRGVQELRFESPESEADDLTKKLKGPKKAGEAQGETIDGETDDDWAKEATADLED